MPSSIDDLKILERLAFASYEDVAKEFGCSRGRVYAAALRHGARKTEARLREKASERKARQHELLQSIINETVTADVIDFLDGIPDESVQLTVTSLPYNVGKSYGSARGADSMRHLFFAGWCRMIISELARVTRPGGVVFLQVESTKDDDGALVPIDIMLFDDLRRAGLIFQNRIVWPASHGLTPKHRLAERYETVLVFSNGNPVFNANAARTPQLNPAKRGYKAHRENFGKLTGHPLGAARTDVWSDVRHVKANDRELSEHPAAFPIHLAKKAILTYSMPGDLVLDCFNGSGSAQIAAVETGRAFVGADLFYEDLRAQRLAKITPDLVTILPGVSERSIAVWEAEARRRDIPALPIDTMRERTLLDELETIG
jgi:DNA modification methylase